MQKPYRKQHIYAFVIGRKLNLLLCAFFGVVMILTLYAVFSLKSPDLYASIYRVCYSKFSDTENNSEKALTLENLMPDVDTVMQTATPLFYAKHSGSESASPESAAASDIQNDESANAKVDAVIAEKNISSRNLACKNETSYNINLHQLADSDVTYTATGNSPRVLILHTHACESYTNAAEPGKTASYRTTDNSRNMVAVGKRLAESLKKSGLNVIHDTTQCDYPTYNNAYKNSLGVAEWYISRYPDIGFVFDIHRDALTDESDNPIKLTCDINGVRAAQIMIVCGTDAMGLNHPNWTENLTLASKLQLYLENNYPGIARPVNVRKERFNMHTTPGSLIFEIGTHGNTLDEALAGADILSKAIEAVLLNKV